MRRPQRSPLFLLLVVAVALGASASVRADGKATAAMLQATDADAAVPLCTIPLHPQAAGARKSVKRAAAAVAAEVEPNDSRADGNFLDLGTAPVDRAAIDVTGALETPVADTIRASEDDGAIPLANPTGLGDDGRIVASAFVGDGPHDRAGGDYDFYAVPALAGEPITIDIDASILGSPLDSYVGVYDGAGNLLRVNDDAPGGATPDSFLRFVAPADDIYFVVVRGFGTGFQTDPFDPASGPGAGSTGAYDIEIERGSAAIDFFRFDLRPGDVIGATVSAAGARLSARAPDGSEIVGSAQDVTGIYPDDSPLPGGAPAAMAWIVSEAGTHAISVAGGSGPYTLQLRALRPALELRPRGDHQILYLDFDGASVDAARLGGSGVRVLSPLGSFLAGWGLEADDEDVVVDAVLATVYDNFAVVARDGRNGDFASSGFDGEYAVDIRNSRDDADPWGQPNVTRIVVGGTIAELGVTTIGVSEAIDVGNFAVAETGVVLLDNLSDPNPANPSSLNQFGVDPSSSVVQLIGSGVGNAISHEAGHLFGSFHTDRTNAQPCLMDIGGDLADIVGVGPDATFGSSDDINVDFATDVYVSREGFSGNQDTLNTTAFGLSTGVALAVDTATATATPTATATVAPGTPTPPPATSTRTPSSTPVPPGATATRTPAFTPPPPGICADRPRLDCRASPRSILKLRRVAARPDRNRFEWKWMKGKAERDELGAPLTRTSYDLCLYGHDGLLMTVSVSPGRTCPRGRPCWRESGRGYDYRDRDRTNGGVEAMTLRSGDGRARVQLKARGTDLPLPALPLFVPVTAQLVSSDGACWTARYTLLGGNNLDHVVARSTEP